MTLVSTLCLYRATKNNNIVQIYLIILIVIYAVAVWVLELDGVFLIGIFLTIVFPLPDIKLNKLHFIINQYLKISI